LLEWADGLREPRLPAGCPRMLRRSATCALGWWCGVGVEFMKRGQDIEGRVGLRSGDEISPERRLPAGCLRRLRTSAPRALGWWCGVGVEFIKRGRDIEGRVGLRSGDEISPEPPGWLSA
jgi:hypothetical protein